MSERAIEYSVVNQYVNRRGVLKSCQRMLICRHVDHPFRSDAVELFPIAPWFDDAAQWRPALSPIHSHSANFDHRRRPEVLRTAMAMAFF